MAINDTHLNALSDLMDKKKRKPAGQQMTMPAMDIDGAVPYAEGMEPQVEGNVPYTEGMKPQDNRAAKMAAPVTPKVEQPETVPPVQEEDSNFDWGSLLVGATPALMGLLTGDTEAGYGLGAQGIQQLHKERREDKKVRDVASAKDDKLMRGRFPLKRYTDPKTGVTKFRAWDSALGQWAEGAGDVAAGYKPFSYNDTRTGERTMKSASGGQINMRDRHSNAPYNMNEEADRNRIKDKVLGDKSFQTAQKVMSTSGRALSLLNANNPIADSGIKTIFPRMFGEVGNLSWQEQENFAGSPELIAKYDALMTKYGMDKKGLPGGLTDANRADLMEVAQIMYEYDKHNLSAIANTHVEAGKRGYQVDASDLVQPFLDRGYLSPKNTVDRAQAKSPTKGKTPFQTIPAEGGGFWKYKMQPDGGYIDLNPKWIKKR